MNSTLSRLLFYYPVTALRGEYVWRYHDSYEASQWFDHNRLQQYQDNALQALLKHADNHVPWYRDLFKQNNIDINDIRTTADLARLPTLSKSDIVDHFDAMQANVSMRRSSKTTGGSTGQAVTLIKNADALARERAATARAYRWAGIEIGDAQARFWGVPLTAQGKLKYRAIDFVTNRTRLSAFNTNDKVMQEFYSKLLRLKPKYFYGYVSIILDFARYYADNKLAPIPGLQCIITTSEVLSDEARHTIEATFGVKVYNEYGCGEVGSIAHECEHGNMHIMADNLVVEIDTNANPDGNSGELVVTDLFNYAMPLIRYRLGDFASLANEACACGRGLPVIEKIHGRAYDTIVTAEGNRYHPEVLMYVFEELKTRNSGIRQFQVIQKKHDLFSVNLVTNDDFDKSMESKIELRICECLQSNITAEFLYPNEIQRERSGKLRVIKSELEP